MDRRIVSGFVGLTLVVAAEACPAQSVPARDPSAQPPVGLSPLPSIGDSINRASLDAPPPAYARAPTSPVGGGPAATIPRAPVLTEPVGLAPIEPIHQSINRGFGTGRIASMFRRPAARAASPSSPPPALRPQAPGPPAFAPRAGPPAPTVRPPTDPDSPGPAGRPAPYAGRAPETPRAQAGPAPVEDGAEGAGRTSPVADDRPRAARPQAPAGARPPAPRPRPEPSNPPAFRPVEPPIPAPSAALMPSPSTSPEPMPGPMPMPVVPADLAPVDLPPAPVLEAAAVPPLATNPPTPGTDPPQGSDPLAAVAPPAVAVEAPTPAPAPSENPAPAPAPAPTRADPEMRRMALETGRDEEALKLKTPVPRVLPHAALRAAAVGDQIITFNELNVAVSEAVVKEFGGGKPEQMPDSQFRQLTNQIAASVLNRLIEESLIVQEAKRKMQKDDKAQQRFHDTLDKMWKAEEVPPLLRKYACANVYELKDKLAADGKSYEALKEVYRKKVMANEFLRSEIHHKLSCDLSEQRAYYVAHLKDFEQPARMTWREVEINVARYPDRAAARRRAEDVLARLLHDESFEAVARAVSDGPTAGKGGAYVDMQPGSYGIPEVNDELNRLPVGQVSRVLEAPGSFHVVRVDSRRAKGPLRFDEVQDQIKAKVFDQNVHQTIEAYVAKLRAKTLIRTMFDDTESDPNVARRNRDPAVRTASGTR